MVAICHAAQEHLFPASQAASSTAMPIAHDDAGDGRTRSRKWSCDGEPPIGNRWSKNCARIDPGHRRRRL